MTKQEIYEQDMRLLKNTNIKDQLMDIIVHGAIFNLQEVKSKIKAHYGTCWNCELPQNIFNERCELCGELLNMEH